ncbi:hypothetical protein BPAE_0040g00010 [Botrytis paeoniae]|uniref:Uncharacterized protein n=1 Tax=Botrytis paeoniae TaxID=278948 RepID=A0A4Z1FWV7_9HELO|nr:hypothetical protein BPAE_0040g00010 [Botrytis paeoniae]
MSFTAEGLYLVRRFSELTRNEKIAEPLSQGLAEKLDHDIERERKGKYFYEEVTQKTKKVNQITGNYGHDLYSLPGFLESKLSNLEEKSDKLSVAWRNLEDKLKLDKTGVPTTSGNNGTDILLLTVQLQRDILQKKQESKGAKVKNFLKRTIQSLVNHKYLFALLPSGDKYTSVLTGASSALVKASVTHDKIADEISDALDDISDQVRSFGIAAATTRLNSSNSSLNSSPRWLKESILEYSEFLRQYIQASVDVDRLIVMVQSLVVNADTLTRIRQWIIAPSSEILWIEGPHGVEQPGQNTLVSAFILRNLRLAYLPVMAEFCHYDARDWRTWIPAIELLKVVYGLIGQTINIMEDDIETNGTYPDFSAERFQRLKENTDALPATIQLLADLISV